VDKSSTGHNNVREVRAGDAAFAGWQVTVWSYMAYRLP